MEYSFMIVSIIGQRGFHQVDKEPFAIMLFEYRPDIEKQEGSKHTDDIDKHMVPVGMPHRFLKAAITPPYSCLDSMDFSMTRIMNIPAR